MARRIPKPRVKDGIHIVVPRITSCPFIQHNVRESIFKNAGEVLDECKFTNEFSPKFSPVIYLIHDGLNNYLIQYQFQVRPGFATLTVGCDTNQNCNTMNEYAKNIILSIRN